MVTAYFALLAFVALERLRELAIAQAHAKKAFARGGVEHGKTHYRAMVLLHATWFAACALEPIVHPRPLVPSLFYGGFALVLLAQLLRAWAMRSLGDRWNTRLIVLPEADPIVRGPYRFLRHPNYVAVVVELFALPAAGAAYATAIAFSLLNAVILTIRIRAEEAALGSRWAAAFAPLPRFVPGGRRE